MRDHFILSLFIVAFMISGPVGVVKPGCVFCDPVVIKQQQFYEDTYVRGLDDLKPLIEGHKLVIPKRHVLRFEELTDQEILAVKHLIDKLQTPHYWIVQKNNLMNSVPHVHFHLIPKPQGLSDLKFVLKIFIARFNIS